MDIKSIFLKAKNKAMKKELTAEEKENSAAEKKRSNIKALNKVLGKGFSLPNFKNKSKTKSVYDRLNEGQSITWKPESIRYTYNNSEDTQFNKKWKPESTDEKKSLSPDGYYRQNERQQVKDDIYSGIFDAALRKSIRENPDALLSTVNEKAKEEADDIFNSQYQEKTIAIPSTALNTIDYDPKTEGLTVTFQNNNKKYFYPAVPLELVQALMKAPSKGEFFLKNIHDQYTMNPGHKPAGKSKSYGKMSKKQVEKFFSKYIRDYKKHNKKKWGNK